jgi:hypothetical protein
MLKSNKCRLEDNTKMNLKETERVLEFFRLIKKKRIDCFQHGGEMFAA